MIVEDMKQLQRQKRLDSLEAERMKMDKKAEQQNIQRRLQAERIEEEMELQLTKVCNIVNHPNFVKGDYRS